MHLGNSAILSHGLRFDHFISLFQSTDLAIFVFNWNVPRSSLPRRWTAPAMDVRVQMGPTYSLGNCNTKPSLPGVSFSCQECGVRLGVRSIRAVEGPFQVQPVHFPPHSLSQR